MGELTGARKERRAKIRLNSDYRYSVFTWADYGGNVGITQWRERHDVPDYQSAYAIYCEWINGSR